MESGVVTLPGDKAAFVLALRALPTDNARRTALGAAARTEALAALSRDAVLTTFERHLQTLLGQASADRNPSDRDHA